MLLIILPFDVRASLHFTGGSSDKVSIATAPSINNMQTVTVAGWFYLDSVSNNRRGLVSKESATGPTGWAIHRVGGVGTKLLFFTNLTTTNMQSRCSGCLATGWIFLAVTWSTASNPPAAAPIIYKGTLTSLVTAVALDIAVAGSGVTRDDSAITLRLSQIEEGSSNLSNDGKIAWVGIWNRQLTLGEILAQQFFPHVTSGNVLFMFPGFNGTGTQVDYSGNRNNGTVTGTTIDKNPSLRNSFGM